MPIFEFQCEKCGHRFEKIMSQTEKTPPCAECGGNTRKAVSTFATSATTESFSPAPGGGCGPGGFS